MHPSARRAAGNVFPICGQERGRTLADGMSEERWWVGCTGEGASASGGRSEGESAKIHEGDDRRLTAWRECGPL